MLRVSMVPWALMTLLVAPVLPAQEAAAAKPAQDTVLAKACASCEKIKVSGDGWCTSCANGVWTGLPVKSKAVYVILEGEALPADVTTLKCAECVKVAKTGGVCTTCNRHYVRGRVYRSAIVYAIVKGEPIKADVPSKCPTCAKAILAGEGYCDACKVFHVRHYTFKEKPAYETAVAASKTVVEAIKASATCESCASVMLTDGKCGKCGTTFEKGKKIG